jgi:hypothetical protein
MAQQMWISDDEEDLICLFRKLIESYKTGEFSFMTKTTRYGRINLSLSSDGENTEGEPLMDNGEINETKLTTLYSLLSSEFAALHEEAENVVADYDASEQEIKANMERRQNRLNERRERRQRDSLTHNR